MTSLSLRPLSVNRLICLMLLALLYFNSSSCKKKSTPSRFTYEGLWIVTYKYTTGNTVSGSFKATLKNNGKWDYSEGTTFSQTDAGTWTSSGDNVNFKFSGFGLADYKGSKVSNNSLQGTMIADNGVSTGTWTAAR